MRQSSGWPQQRSEFLRTQAQGRPQQRDAQQQIGQRAGGDDGEALSDRFVVECRDSHRRGQLLLAAVAHLDITAERDQCQAVFGAIPANPVELGASESDREPVDMDAAPACHDEMPPFVNGHQHADGEYVPEYGADEVGHGSVQALGDGNGMASGFDVTGH